MFERTKEIAGLVYRNDELPIKDLLERIFGPLHKEKVGPYYMDFANNNVLIEHTIDGTKGVQDLTKRFTEVASRNDVRKRIAYVRTKCIGKIRWARLERLNVELRDIVELTNPEADRPKRATDRSAELVEVKCDWCGNTFTCLARKKRERDKLGQKVFFCCRSHAVKHQNSIGAFGEVTRTKRSDHGLAMYRKGCKCDKCLAASADRTRKYRQSRK